MPMSGKEMLRKAKKSGWKLDRVDGSHHIVEKKGFKPVSIPVHGNKDLPKGLESNLLKGLGLK